MMKLVIAHRGASRYKPENTVAAFELALEQRADMVEMDIRKLPSGVLVLSHDPVAHGADLVRFTEVLQRLQGRTRLDLELKEIGYEQEVIGLALRYFPAAHVWATSYFQNAVRAVKELYPQVSVGVILGPTSLRNTWELLKFCCRPMGVLEQSDFLVLHKSLYKAGFMRVFSSYKKPVYVCTVNSPKTMEKLARDERVSGIITDVPDVCFEVLNLK